MVKHSGKIAKNREEVIPHGRQLRPRMPVPPQRSASYTRVKRYREKLKKIQRDMRPTKRKREINVTRASVDKIKVNSYIAVKFQGAGSKTKKHIVYMALVTDVRDARYQVKFMRRNSQGLYEFTAEREATHPKSDIIMILEEPDIVQAGRAFQYKFNTDEVEDLESEFTLK